GALQHRMRESSCVLSTLTQQIKLAALVGWVEQSATQQNPRNVGLPCGILLRSSNATCYPTGTLRANKSGNRKGAVAPQPTQFKVFGALTQAY
ncbi:MAG: hypothetical protein V7L20_20250, partial [Nostoc sp.]|uniref:hypothetical protein n=1 Tax=Nostoc sp. TaxID=1180 RepID=UPI002FFAD934